MIRLRGASRLRSIATPTRQLIFSIDTSCGLLLRTAAVDPNCKLVEQILFVALSVGSPMNDTLLQPQFLSRKSLWRHKKLTLREAQAADVALVLLDGHKRSKS